MRYIGFNYSGPAANYTLGDENTIILSAFDAGTAEPKIYEIDLPGTNGKLDLSTALTDGSIMYNNRIVTITFTVLSSANGRTDVLTGINTIKNLLHGQKIYFSNSGETKFFHGRASVSVSEDHYIYAIVVVTVDCDPYIIAQSDRGDTHSPVSPSTTYNFSETNHGNAPTVMYLDIPEGVTVTVTKIIQLGTFGYTDYTTRSYGTGVWKLTDTPFYPGNLRVYFKASGTFTHYLRERDL